MNATLVWAGAGAVLVLLLIFIGRRSNRIERLWTSLGLMALGFWYLAFGVSSGASLAELLPQIIGGTIFAGLGWKGLNHKIFERGLFFVGLGWLMHGTWDFASPHFSDVSYMPHWSAPMCLGFDLLLGVYLLSRAQEYFEIPKVTEA